ncbi:MAG: PilZ domain-containing protein [Deltaproteobacteria bacterium]|nr:PilZ domain-containing protein [Deltaproteobacteria bacterium]
MGTREHERLPVNQRARVQLADRQALFDLYLKDISRGGLFVETDQPFALRSRIEITLEVEKGGALQIEGEVVHIVTREQAAAWGCAAGVGVQFSDLDLEKRDRLESYLDGVRARLDQELGDAPFDTHIVDQVERGNRRGDLYAVLGIDLQADEVEIEVAVEMRTRALAALLARTDVTPQLRQRIAGAKNAAERAAAVLRDPTRRGSYLFRSSNLPPEQLADLVARWPGVRAEVQRQWEQAFPANAEESQRLARVAQQAFEKKDGAGARQTAALALKKNPFLFELRDALRTWKE